MTKEDYFDLIIKGFGVYLLVLTIIEIPDAIGGLILFMTQLFQHSSESGDVGHVLNAVRTQSIWLSARSIIRLIIYFIVAINFLRSHSIVLRLMYGQRRAEPDAAPNSHLRRE